MLSQRLPIPGTTKVAIVDNLAYIIFYIRLKDSPDLLEALKCSGTAVFDVEREILLDIPEFQCKNFARLKLEKDVLKLI